MVFGNSKLAHPACFPKPPEGSFSAQSALGERQKEGNGLGSLLPPGVPQTLAQRPWLQASKGGAGGGEEAVSGPPEEVRKTDSGRTLDF